MEDDFARYVGDAKGTILGQRCHRGEHYSASSPELSDDGMGTSAVCPFKHRHSTIQFVTPAQRHGDLETAILAKRQALYQAAKARHPERWSQQTRNWQPVQVVHLNPNKTDRNETHNALDKAA